MFVMMKKFRTLLAMKKSPAVSKDQWQTADQDTEVNCSRAPPSISSYLKKTLLKSNINGVNRVAAAKNRCQSILWTIVLLFCVCGFGYQTIEFLRVYYNENPSIVQIRIENNGRLQFPAITICNSNRFRKSVYRNYSDKWKLVLTEDDADRLISEAVYEFLTQRNYTLKFKFGHSSDIIHECQYSTTPRMGQHECLRQLEYFFDVDYGTCYTIPPYNSRGQILEARKPNYWEREYDVALALDVEKEEYLEDKNHCAIITIHDDSMWPDMHEYGIKICIGTFNTFAIKKSTFIMLPHPYKSNCTEFSELPWQKNFKRLLTPRRCTIGCSQYYQLKKCNFVLRTFSIHYDELPFDPKKFVRADQRCANEEERRTVEYCRSICSVPCRVQQFEVSNDWEVTTSKRLITTFTRNEEISSFKRNMTDYWKSNYALLKVYFPNLDNHIFEHTPKYETMELFSFVGSYSGMWLGFSILTIYEMFDIFVSLAIFVFVNQRRKQQRIRTVQIVDTVHRNYNFWEDYF